MSTKKIQEKIMIAATKITQTNQKQKENSLSTRVLLHGSNELAWPQASERMAKMRR